MTQALVRDAIRGDEHAFALLVRQYLRKAMAVALEYARTREDAEDVVQETFRRAWQSLDRFDPDRPFEPWFFTILRNTARNAAKSQSLRAHDALAIDYESQEAGPLETVQRQQMRRRIDEAVNRLPPMQRTCFRLCLVEGLTSAEAAAATGISESTVRVHVFKARRTLQSLLAEWRNTGES